MTKFCSNCIHSKPQTDFELLECTNRDTIYFHVSKNFTCRDWNVRKPDPNKVVFSKEPHNNS